MAAAGYEQWSHAVPLGEENARPYASETISSQDSARAAKPLRKHPSDMMMRSEADRNPSESRRPSVQSNNSIGPRKRSARPLRQPSEDFDDSAWIHRDKLAQIEIQEMADAGFRMRQPRRSGSAGPRRSSSRSMSRNALRKPASREQLNGGSAEDVGYNDDYGRKRVSTIPAASDEQEEGFDPTVDSEIRTPEEVAAQPHPMYQQPLRPSTSRIPISKTSPVPVPPNVVGRDSPLPRSRNGSGAWSGNWDELQYARRARSGSVNSQALLQDSDGVTTPPRPSSAHVRTSLDNSTPYNRSPPKARVPGKDTPTSGARKNPAASNSAARSASSSATKPRVRSGTNSNRPGSSSGRPRPSTSHNRPEGEAPWIATMYKPDPSIPPDQQMLPTHAKRMAQEQWEREGKTGTVYDRDLNLLNDEQFTSRRPSALDIEQQQQQAGSESRSPTRSPKPPGQDMSPVKTDNSYRESESGSVRPGTSGGYRITPTIQTPPALPQPSPSQEAVTKHNATPRVPDFDEKEDAGSGKKKKGGCGGCCAVM